MFEIGSAETAALRHSMASIDHQDMLKQIHAVNKDAESNLVLFQRQFAQRLDLPLIKWPENALLRIYDVQIWLYNVVEEAHHERPQPSYDRRFLKMLVSKIEEAVQDAEEPVCCLRE